MPNNLPDPLKYLLHDDMMIAKHCGRTYIVEDGDILECIVCHRKWKVSMIVKAEELPVNDF